MRKMRSKMRKMRRMRSKMRSKMRKMRSKMRKMRRMRSKMRSKMRRMRSKMRKMRRKCENAKQNAKNANSMRSKMRKMRSKMQRRIPMRIPQGNPNLCKQHQSSMTYLGVWAGSLINLLGSTGPSGLIGP